MIPRERTTDTVSFNAYVQIDLFIVVHTGYVVLHYLPMVIDKHRGPTLEHFLLKYTRTEGVYPYNALFGDERKGPRERWADPGTRFRNLQKTKKHKHLTADNWNVGLAWAQQVLYFEFVRDVCFPLKLVSRFHRPSRRSNSVLRHESVSSIPGTIALWPHERSIAVPVRSV